MSDSAPSLRSRLFGVKRVREKSPEEHSPEAAPPTASGPSPLGIAKRFKASINHDIPEYYTPKRPHLVYSDADYHHHSPHSHNKTSLSRTKAPLLAGADSGTVINVPSRLKDSYAGDCSALHDQGTSKLREAQQSLIDDLSLEMQSSRDAGTDIQLSAAPTNTPARVSHVPIQSVVTLVDGTKVVKTTTAVQIAAQWQADVPRWTERIQQLEVDIKTAETEIEDMFNDIFGHDGKGGPATMKALEDALQAALLDKEDAVQQDQKLCLEARQEVSEKEKEAKEQTQQLKKMLDSFLAYDADDLDENDDEGDSEDGGEEDGEEDGAYDEEIENDRDGDEGGEEE